jgi:hypothetical protein
LQYVDNQFIKNIFEKKMDDISNSRPDLLWKDLFSEFHEDAVLFFFGKELHSSIDFSIEPEFLEQELSDVFTGNNPAKKIADKVIKYRLRNGNDRIIILHVEFQGEFDKNFPERMLWYYMFIAVKYKTTDITALAIYTDATKPKVYDVFEVTHFGTKMSYKFNAYIVRNQKENDLLEADSFFSLAVLAALYLIKAGTDEKKKARFKKKMGDIVLSREFDQKKFFRLLNFVRKLIKLPQPLEADFEQYISQPKIQKAMQADKEFLTHYPIFFEKAVAEIREEGREQEREHLIMNSRRTMGFSADDIAKILGFQVLYVQSVIDKFEKNGQ